ncbi:hypothetical protein MRX96_045591 [Rhipicephalus microplus]
MRGGKARLRAVAADAAVDADFEAHAAELAEPTAGVKAAGRCGAGNPLLHCRRMSLLTARSPWRPAGDVAGISLGGRSTLRCIVVAGRRLENTFQLQALRRILS